MSNYYESEDLKKFGNIGEHAKPLADEFFKYHRVFRSVRESKANDGSRSCRSGNERRRDAGAFGANAKSFEENGAVKNRSEISWH